MRKTIKPIYEEYKQLGIDQQIDYAKFYLYSIITHSTAIEGSTVTELGENLIKQIAEYRKSMEEDEPTISTQDVAVNVAEELTERQRVIVELIKNGVADGAALNVTVNTKYLSEKLNVNRKTIQRDIAHLQERKLIQWVGSYKTGHWEIIKDE